MINNNWDLVLKDEFEKEYFKLLLDKVYKEYETEKIFPKKEDIFNALKYTDYNDIKVVIIGQDPYHGENQAEGLSFSVKGNMKRPPSLRNIFKEIASDIGTSRENNSLVDWSEQGVLLLNAILTVKKDEPLSHKNYGWEQFTDEIIRKIDESEEPVVFLLWGSFAKDKQELIKNKKHLILSSSHPSPFSANRGFLGSKHFSKANEFLENNNKEGIRW